jgi:hypothetical protein
MTQLEAARFYGDYRELIEEINELDVQENTKLQETLMKEYELNKIFCIFLSEFSLEWRTRIGVAKGKKDWMGMYEEYPFSKKHKIRVCLEQCKDYDAVVATIVHEMVHAWQNETGHSVAHGKSFKKWKVYFKQRYGLKI